jgi:hypothetical protein
MTDVFAAFKMQYLAFIIVNEYIDQKDMKKIRLHTIENTKKYASTVAVCLLRGKANSE